MIAFNSLNIEYRGANLSIVYSYIDNILYVSGTMKSTVLPEIKIDWSPCDEGDTIDSFVANFKNIIDIHHARKAIVKAFD